MYYTLKIHVSDILLSGHIGNHFNRNILWSGIKYYYTTSSNDDNFFLLLVIGFDLLFIQLTAYYRSYTEIVDNFLDVKRCKIYRLQSRITIVNNAIK